jgi:uncharacterized pyridoxal phosphate-containing UPF0001 family protein
MEYLAISLPRYESLQERYTNFMNQPNIRHFLGAGGIVTIAAEARDYHQVNALATAGHRHFAEKYWQESEKKYVHPHNLILHYFGVLQSNKIRRIMQGFNHVEGIASRRQADIVDRLLKEEGASLKSKEFFIQLNIGREPSKNGVAPEAAADLIEYCLILNLPVTGVMAIPPKADAPAPHFKALRKLADDYGLPHCQMGFSNDYPIALDCGATHLRIGTAIWGEKYPAHYKPGLQAQLLMES